MLKNLIIIFLLFTISFFVFKSEKTTPIDPISETLVSSEISWNGDSLPSYPEGKPEISILKITIPPNSSLPLHFHPVINAGVLLKGELDVIDEHGNTLKMKAGDPIIEVVNTIHTGKNPGSEPAEILVFYAGVKGMEITKKVDLEK